MNKLRELALESCDPLDWREDDKRDVVVELYDSDEQLKYPAWILDALTESLNDEARARIIAALRLSSVTMSEAIIGKIVRDILLTFPLNWLSQVAEERIWEWRDEEARSA